MKLISILFLLLIISTPVNSAEVTGELICIENNDCRIKEGQFFKARLKIHPMYGENPELFKGFKGKTILDYFYVNEVLNSGFSINNQDVLVLDLELIVKKAYKDKSFVIFPHKGLNIPIDISKLAVGKNDIEYQNFILRSRKKPKKVSTTTKVLILVVAAALLIVLVFFGVRKYLRSREIKNFKKQKDIWLNALNKASSRHDFENIFRDRDEWTPYFEGEEDNIANFLNEINKVQYKKNISESELGKLKDLVSEFRNYGMG